jgi:hypothetical protein
MQKRLIASQKLLKNYRIVVEEFDVQASSRTSLAHQSSARTGSLLSTNRLDLQEENNAENGKEQRLVHF